MHIQKYLTTHRVAKESGPEREDTEEQYMRVCVEVHWMMNFCAMYHISLQKCIYQRKHSHLPAAR